MGTKKSLNLTDLFYKKSETRTRAEITSEIDSTIRSHEVISAKEEKANKTTSWGNPLSDVKYPSEKLVKTDLNTKASTSDLESARTTLQTNINTLETNTNTAIGQINTALNGKVDKVSGKGLSTNDYTSTDKDKLANIEVRANRTIVDDELDSNSTNPVQNAVICAEFDEFYDKADIVNLLNNIETGHGKLLSIYIDEDTGDLVVDDDGFQYYTATEVDNGFTVNVEKQSQAESGYIATYVIKQGGTQKGVKINIPKDYLVKSATVETCSTANTPIQGLAVGDKYIDFVINTKDSSSSSGNEHLYLNLHDLTDVYTADNSTLQLSNSNVFSVKDGGISTSKLDSTLQTAIGSISDKVDKVTGKGLSANDFTNSYKSQLDNLSSDLADKVDKETGKGLSSNDFTGAYKTQLDGLSTSLAGKVNVNQGSSNSGKYLRVDTDGTVICATAPSSGGGSSFSGDYLDLVNTPDIPDKTSDLTNDGDGVNPFLTVADLGSVELLVTFTDDSTLSLNLFKEVTQ